jgi:hypothetical protein
MGLIFISGARSATRVIPVSVISSLVIAGHPLILLQILESLGLPSTRVIVVVGRFDRFAY